VHRNLVIAASNDEPGIPLARFDERRRNLELHPPLRELGMGLHHFCDHGIIVRRASRIELTDAHRYVTVPTPGRTHPGEIQLDRRKDEDLPRQECLSVYRARKTELLRV